MHGLRQFIARVPAFCLASIKEIDFVACRKITLGWRRVSIHSNSKDSEGIVLEDEISIICRLIKEHLVGLNTVNIQIDRYGTSSSENRAAGARFKKRESGTGSDGSSIFENDLNTALWNLRQRRPRSSCRGWIGRSDGADMFLYGLPRFLSDLIQEVGMYRQWL